MVIADQHMFHPRFTEALSEDAPLSIKGIEALSDFWHPVPHSENSVHPLTILSAYNKEVWRCIRMHKDDPRQSAIRVLYQNKSLRGVMKFLDTLTAAEESAFWYNDAEEEWAALQKRAEIYINRSSWGYKPKHAHAFRESVAVEYLRYKNTALALFAYRRTDELTRQAHFDRDFSQIKTIIRQWLQPAWVINATGSSTAMDRIRRGGGSVSPMDYYSRLGGGSILTDKNPPPFNGTKEAALDQWFLNPSSGDSDSILSSSHYRTNIGEQDSVFIPNLMHTLFTRVFSKMDAAKGKPETGALWLSAPSAACLQMWLDLEQEFRSSITKNWQKKGALLPSESWQYQVPYMCNSHIEEPLQDKVELILRMASRFKHTLPDNFKHCQTLLSSAIYRHTLESLSIPPFENNNNDVHYRIAVLRYGKGVPFFSDLPWAEGTYGWNGGLPNGGLSTVSAKGAFRPPPADAPRDTTLEHELAWRIDAADMRIRAGLSTPKVELELLLDAVGWGSKIYSANDPDPSFDCEHFMYYSITGDKDEVWYTSLYKACRERWSLSEQEWDAAILNLVSKSNDALHITALAQYWLSADKWSLFQYMKRENLDFNTCLINTINAFSRLYKIYAFNNVKLGNTLSNFDSAPEKSINRYLLDNNTKYKQKVSEGLDFIRFNLILQSIQEINPFLEHQYLVPNKEEDKILLKYIFQNFEGVLKHEMSQLKGSVYGDDLLRNVIKSMQSASAEMLVYDDIVTDTSLDNISF